MFQGKVQLIDATAMKSPLRKNLGNKNCELTPEIRNEITKLLMNFAETEQSKVFDNREFGYYKVTVERPLRLAVDLSETNLDKFEQVCQVTDDMAVMSVLREVAKQLDYAMVMDYNAFLKKLDQAADNLDIKLPAKRINFIKSQFAKVNEQAVPVIKKIHKSGKAEKNSLYGLYNIENKIVEYVPDAALRDTEQISLLHEGGIGAFLEEEVLPFAPDAWIDVAKTQIGYEISFTKYFYKPVKLRTLEEIVADIKALETETDGLLNEIIGG